MLMNLNRWRLLPSNHHRMAFKNRYFHFLAIPAPGPGERTQVLQHLEE